MLGRSSMVCTCGHSRALHECRRPFDCESVGSECHAGCGCREFVSVPDGLDDQPAEIAAVKIMQGGRWLATSGQEVASRSVGRRPAR